MTTLLCCVDLRFERDLRDLDDVGRFVAEVERDGETVRAEGATAPIAFAALWFKLNKLGGFAAPKSKLTVVQ